MMDRIPSLSLTGLTLAHHPLSQSLAVSTNSSTASLNQQALNSLNFHQQAAANNNHHHNQHQITQNMNHSHGYVILTLFSQIPLNKCIPCSVSYSSAQQQQMHQTNLHHHHQQLNGLLNNVSTNG